MTVDFSLETRQVRRPWSNNFKILENKAIKLEFYSNQASLKTKGKMNIFSDVKNKQTKTLPESQIQ